MSELRELFRNLKAFRAVFEDTGLEDIKTPAGTEWSIWDLEYLHTQFDRLTLPQRQAITLCLVHNLREKDAARIMGVSETNPVSMYATLGLQRLLDMVDAGELTRYREQRLTRNERVEKHNQSLALLVKRIESVVTEVSTGCWIYPNRSASPPRLMIRSPRTSSGFMSISPMTVLFQSYVGPVPLNSQVTHRADIEQFSISCVNPYHGQLVLSSAYKARMQLLAAQYNRRKAVA